MPEPNAISQKLPTACVEDDLVLAGKLIRDGADVNARSRKLRYYEGCSPLYIACSRGNLDLASLLVEAGAREKDALHMVCGIQSNLDLKGKMAVIKLLLTHGSDVNYFDNGMDTPLQIAASSGCEDTTKLLIEKGALVNGSNGECFPSPLHDASYRGHIPVMRLLLDHGALVNCAYTQELHNCTPIWANFTRFYGTQGYKQSLRVLELLLASGADVAHWRDWNGATVLHECSAIGANPIPCEKHMSGRRHARLLRLLIQQGVDVNVHGSTGKTALHILCRMLLPPYNVYNVLREADSPTKGYGPHRTAAVRTLLTAGADPDACDDNGTTPLHLAARDDHGGAVLKALLRRRQRIVYA